MGKAGALPIPGVVCVAPDTMQVAEACAHKNGGYADAFAFSLYGIEHLRPAVQARKFEQCVAGIRQGRFLRAKVAAV